MGSVRFSGLRPGDACVVYGAGLIGQLVARLAKCAGSTRVFVCDISDLRLDKLPDDPCFVKINTLKDIKDLRNEIIYYYLHVYLFIKTVYHHQSRGQLNAFLFSLTDCESLP